MSSKAKPKEATGIGEAKRFTSFRWDAFLTHVCGGINAAPVDIFEYCPFEDNFSHFFKLGMITETLNVFDDQPENVYWLARITVIKGYMIALQYIPGGSDLPLVWVNIGNPFLYRMGHCKRTRKRLRPPMETDDLLGKLTEETLNHPLLSASVRKTISLEKRCKLKAGCLVEVLNMAENGRAQLGLILDVKHHRLRIQFGESTPDPVWLHMFSGMVQLPGWCGVVGLELDASDNYRMNSAARMLRQMKQKDPPEKALFLDFPANGWLKAHLLCSRMRLAVIHPCRPSEIHVALVMKTLAYGYFTLLIDQDAEEQNASATNAEFCFHVSSTQIMPIAHCIEHGIPLHGPKRFTRNGAFCLQDYLNAKGDLVAPPDVFSKTIAVNRFEPGMKLEAVDLRPLATTNVQAIFGMNTRGARSCATLHPALIYVCTVVRVVDRLLRIRFDRWAADYDQWMDCQSPNIFPVGYCELTGQKLQLPNSGKVGNKPQ